MDCAKCRKWSRSCMEIQTVPLSLCPVPSQQLLHKIKSWNWFQLLDCWDQCRYSAAAPVNGDFESQRWSWAWNGAKSESKKLCEKMWMRRNRDEARNWFSEAHVMWFARRDDLWSPPMSHQCDCGLFTASLAHSRDIAAPQNDLDLINTPVDPSFIFSLCWRVSGEGDDVDKRGRLQFQFFLPLLCSRHS